MHASKDKLILRCLCAVVVLVSPAAVSADEAKPGHRRVAVSYRYDKGAVHAFVFGGGHRDLWSTEIELPVVDLGKVGGGLEPVGRFGGLQTAVLGFKGKDGRAYSFRGTDKDPSAVLPEVLRNTFARSLVQDQMAAQHPAGPLAAGVISEAAGVLTIHERMVIIPDDPRLGKYREEFAGMVGSLYEYPLPEAPGRPGFHGATEIIDYKELYTRLRRSNDDRVWTQAFLRARLIDILLGDFDRHRKQWRWVKLPGEPRWQPLPEDRDQAFVRYDGYGSRVVYIYIPILQNYGPEYPRISGLTLHGWEQDRWLLAGLDWPTWQATVTDIQARLTDDVVDRAIAALPLEFAAMDGERLRADLRGRRDNLARGARKFYDHLAGQVDVQTSSASDDVQVTWSDAGALTVEVRDRSADRAWFRRQFLPDETDEVRVYLRGGDDVVTVRGDAGAIMLRVLAEGGNKVLDDGPGGDTRLYDETGATTVTHGPGTSVIDDRYQLPESDAGFVDVKDVPPRDWGDELIPLPVFGYEKDVGAVVGLGAIHTVFGFRKHPWASRYEIQAAYATEALQPLLRFKGGFHPENSELLAEVDVRFSGIEILRFHGLGNESKSDGEDSFYDVLNQQVSADVMLGASFFDDMLQVSGGVWAKYSDTIPGDRLIDQIDPLGADDYGAAGGALHLTVDSRETIDQEGGLVLPMHPNPAAGYPVSGFFFELDARLGVPLSDPSEVWGSVGGSVAAHLGFFEQGRLALAFRVGGQHTFGPVPYFAAAYLGGGGTFSGDAAVRGLRPQRYGGDSSVFGNVDVRLFIAHLNLGLPTDVGIFGFGDVGRVFLEGEDSDAWHPAGGGGIWLAPLARTNVISFSVAKSEEELLFYFRSGFHF